ncbi:MAG TPA: hypothetical protein VLT33_46930, partial [Labilithrix sp.]|nr:hypothetical protein [Labilithrix sp.]
FVVEVTGTAAQPVVHASFQATELGFRFGRPRFHPAQIAGRLDLVIDVADGGVRVAASLALGAGSLALEAVLAREPAGARALTISATEVEPSWIAAVTTALAGTTRLRVDDGSPVTLSPFTVPRAARLGASLVVDLSAQPPPVRGRVTVTTPRRDLAPEGTSLVLEGALAADRRVDGTSVRGTLAIADLLTTGLFDGALRPLPEGALRVEATLKGHVDDVVLSGFVTAAQLSLAFYERADSTFQRSTTSPVIPLTELAALFRYDRSKLVWHRLAARAYGGTIGGVGMLGRAGAFVGLQTAVAVRDVAAGHLPIDASGRTLSDLAHGRLAVDMRFDREGASPRPTTGSGALRLEDGVFPLLLRAKAPLEKYGLALPAQSASAPATCSIVLHERGWSFGDVSAAVPGCATTGRVDLTTDGALDGALVVKLGQELLEKSAVTLLPSLLAEHLVVPVRITGAASRPHVDADLAACFGRLLSDNRVSTLLSEAAGGVASLFTGKEAPRAAGAEPGPSAVLAPDPYGAGARGDAAAEDALIRALVAAGADWNDIDARVDAHRRGETRPRVG